MSFQALSRPGLSPQVAPNPIASPTRHDATVCSRILAQLPWSGVSQRLMRAMVAVASEPAPESSAKPKAVQIVAHEHVLVLHAPPSGVAIQTGVDLEA